MKFCIDCGAPNIETRTNCYYCNSPLVDEKSLNEPQKPFPIIIVTIIIIIVAILTVTQIVRVKSTARSPESSTQAGSSPGSAAGLTANGITVDNDSTSSRQSANIRAEDNDRLASQAGQLIDEFCAIDSKLDVGITFPNYADKVGDLKVSLDRFGRLPDGRNHNVYQNLSKALNEYIFAKDVWQYYLDSDETNSFFSASSTYGQLLVDEYHIKTTSISGINYIFLDEALGTIWTRAKGWIKTAQRYQS